MRPGEPWARKRPMGPLNARFLRGLVVILAPVAAGAAPRTVTIAAGDCNYSELSAAALNFSAAVAARPGPDVLNSDAVLERFRRVPASTAEELGRQLETAQTQFYAG